MGLVFQQDYDKLKVLGGENFSKMGFFMLGNVEKNKVVKREVEVNFINLSVYEFFKVRKVEDKLKENFDKVLENRVLDGKLSFEKSDVGFFGVVLLKIKLFFKLLFCIVVIVVFSVKKVVLDFCRELVVNLREFFLLLKEVNDSLRVVDKFFEF